MEVVIEGLLEQPPEVVARIEATLPAGFPQEVSEPTLRGIEYGVGRLA